MSDDILRRAREVTGPQIAERMVERAYARGGREEGCGLFIDFLRAEYPGLGLTNMSRFNRMDQQFRKEALDKFRARGSHGRPWLTSGDRAADTLRMEEGEADKPSWWTRHNWKVQAVVLVVLGYALTYGLFWVRGVMGLK